MTSSPHPLSLAAFADRSRRLDQLTEAARAEFSSEQAFRVIAERTIALEQLDAFVDRLIEQNRLITDPQAFDKHLEKVKAAVHAERDMRQKMQVSLAASKRARAKHLKDPKQVAKEKVRALWQQWQQHPDNWTSVAEFARDMLNAFPELGSHAVIERWCRAWKKEALKPVS